MARHYCVHPPYLPLPSVVNTTFGPSTGCCHLSGTVVDRQGAEAQPEEVAPPAVLFPERKQSDWQYLSVFGYGSVFSGGKAQLRLFAGSTSGRPTGSHKRGEIYMDSNGALFVCVRGGTPGTWRKVSTTAV